MKTSILIGILACAGAACTAYALIKRKQAIEAAKNEVKSVDFDDLFGDEEGDAVEASTGHIHVNIPEDDTNSIFDSLENIMNTMAKNIHNCRTKADEMAEQKASEEEDAAVMNWINDPCNPFDETLASDTSADVSASEDAVELDSSKDTKSDDNVCTFDD